MNWLDPISGKVYAGDDAALIGRGMPPTVPLDDNCGTYEMVPTDKEPPDPQAGGEYRSELIPGPEAPTWKRRIP